MRILGFAVAAGLVSLLVASAANADPGALITANGTWSGSAPTTDISAPDASWSISFIEPSPLNSDPGTQFGEGWATDTAGSLVYTLNTSTVALDFSQAIFYDAGYGGGVDISFDTNGVPDTLSIYSTTSTPYVDENTGAVISPLPFSELIDVDYDDSNFPTGFGTGTLSITSTTYTPSNPNDPGPGNFGAPEPRAWILMIVGLGLAGGALRRRSTPFERVPAPAVGARC